MKKWIFCLLLTIPFSGSAQSLDFSGFFGKYSRVKGCTTVEITGEMMRVMGNMTVQARGTDGNFFSMLDGMRTIRVVIAKSPDEKFQEEIDLLTLPREYALLTSVNEEGKRLKFYSRTEKNGSRQGKSAPVPEYLMVSQDDKECVVIQIIGNIDLKSIAKLPAAMNNLGPGKMK